MCDVTPQILSARVFAADGTTPVPGKGPLVPGHGLHVQLRRRADLRAHAHDAHGRGGDRPERAVDRHLPHPARRGHARTARRSRTSRGPRSGSTTTTTIPSRITFNRTLTNGTPGTADHEDAHTVTVALQGYFFEKSVANLSTGVNPTATAVAGETLRYTLRLQATEVPLDDITFQDDLGLMNASAVFVPGSLALVAASIPPGADASNTDPNGGTNNAGLLDIRNLDIPANGAVQIQFDITLSGSIPDGTIILNQADLISIGVKIADSDDPNINGQADPTVPGDEDPTRIVINTPAPTALTKANTQATAAVGDLFAYRVTVPSTPFAYPMYDVRITDDLSASPADLSFVSVAKIAGSGAWTPTNTGTATNLVIEDPAIGIDIPAGEQVAIEITVRLLDTPTNVTGLQFTNTADYTFNLTNGAR